LRAEKKGKEGGRKKGVVLAVCRSSINQLVILGFPPPEGGKGKRERGGASILFAGIEKKKGGKGDCAAVAILPGMLP